jgi:hypothetical protein
MKLRDDVCLKCCNRKSCRGLCPPLLWANGRVEGKERLLSDIIDTTKDLAYQDYKDVINELADDREQRDAQKMGMIAKIVEIKELLPRSIAALLFFEVPKNKICALLKISRTHFYRKYF